MIQKILMEEKNKEEKNTEKKNAYKDEDIEMKEPEGQKVDKIEEEKKEKERKSPKKEKSISELEKLIDYKYNENGELINKKTGQKCGKLNKQEYDLVGIYVQKYVENLIIKTFDLNILYVPNHNPNPDFLIRDESIPQCKILTTKDFPTNPKCLILIQGTGVVRLGQWARSVCINENLNIGTMIPYVNKAIDNKFSVIIFGIFGVGSAFFGFGMSFFYKYALKDKQTKKKLIERSGDWHLLHFCLKAKFKFLQLGQCQSPLLSINSFFVFLSLSDSFAFFLNVYMF